MNKKILGLILACCMIITTLVPMVVSADGLLVLSGNDVLEADGFYDNTPDSEATEPEAGVGTNSVILQHGEWVKYDISSLMEGTYKVSIKYASKGVAWKDYVYLDALVDGVLLERRKIEDTASAQTFSNMEFCKLYIGEDAKTITLRNSSQRITPENEKATYIPQIDIESITFTYISASDKSDGIITSNAAQNVINQTSGDGFYDANCGEDYNSNNATANAITNKLVTTAWQAVGDYCKYDISELKAGAYKLSIKAGTRINASKLNVYVDNEKVINAAALIYDATTTGVLADGTETVNNLGQIMIPENASVLKFENAAGHIYAGDFTLEYVGDSLVYEEKTINALDVYGGSITSGEGVGYHDTIKTDGSLEVTYNKYVVGRTGKWMKYDASGLEGFYKVYMYSTGSNGGTVASMNYYVNDSTIPQSAVANITYPDAYVTHDYHYVGVVKFDGGENQTLKVEFGNVVGAAFVESFHFEKVSVFDLEREAKQYSVGVATDYYNLSTSQGYIRNNTEFVINDSEWLKFDVSGLWGAYDVTLNSSGGGTSKVSSVSYVVNDTKETAETVDIAFTDYTVYKDYNLGTVVLDGSDNQSLKIIFKMSGAGYAKSIKLTPVEIDEMTISAPSVSAGGEGIGFHDLTGNLSLVNGGKDVAFNDSEWVKYDVPFLKGMFEVTIYASGNDGGKIKSAKISANDELQLDKKLAITNTGYGNFADHKIGYVSFDGDIEQTLKIQFAIAGASYVKAIKLKKVDSVAEVLFTDASGAVISEIGENANVKADVVFANGEAEAKDVYVVIAKYNGTRLLSATPEIINVASNKVDNITRDVVLDGGETVKVFVWNVEEGETLMVPEGALSVIK